MKSAKKRFHLLQFRWLLWVDAIVVVGAVMSFGLVGVLFFQMDETNAVNMLGMLPPMQLAVGLSTYIIIRTLERRMGALLDGIQAVAEGDLTVELDTRRSNEYRILYENFNRMTRELRKTKEEMQSFVNEFSHEFKTPITSIHGFAQLLLETGEGLETAERMTYLQVIADESLRLSELSQKTLLLSRVEACEIITEKEDFDLAEQIKRCVILLLPQMEKKKIELELDLPEHLCYYGNPELMEQVWLNLLGNAMKFTPENGEIAVTAGLSQEGISVSVSDTGVGMDAQTAERIFDRYYQSPDGRSRGGNGIGLSIVKRIVTLCAGTVTVRSAPGEGSTFTVVLKK